MNTTQSGLLVLRPETENQPVAIPLTGVRIHQKVVGTLSQVTLEQHFTNREQTPVEAVYVFPLEARAAVHGFVVTIGERLITGEVASRDEAFETYDDALAEGHGAFLLDQERPNVFTASVGNLEPGQSASITLKYVTELDRTRQGIRVMIPTTVSPRYVPAAEHNHAGFTAADRVSPPVSSGEVPYKLDLTVDIDLLAPIAQIESPSHRISVSPNGNRATVTLAGDDNSLDRDFVLLARPESTVETVSRLATDSQGRRYVAATFRPDLPSTRRPVELVFLVDCSGSMGGRSMKQARKALQLGLQSLEPGDRFDVVRFGSTHECLFGSTAPFSDGTLNRARTLFEGMEADLGGTEILTPLREILRQPASAGFARRVVLITDGQVANDEAVIALAAEHRRTTRIFSFGVGHGASEHLIRGVAKASGGSAEMITPGERIEEAVMRNFERITLGCLDNAVIAFEGLKVEGMTPAVIPPLSSGQEFTVLARVLSGTEGRAVLSGQVFEATIRAEARVVPALEADSDPELDFLPTIWARRRLAELEAGKAAGPGLGSRQSGRKSSLAQNKILELAMEFGLMSSETSFVAVEERADDQRTTERAKLRRVPVQLTRGWGDGVPGIRRSVGGNVSVDRLMDSIEPVDSISESCAEMPLRDSKFPVDHSSSVGPSMKTSRTYPTTLDQILNLQAADGSWPLNAKLANILGLEEAALVRAAHSQLEDSDLVGTLVGTLVVLAVVAELGDAVPDSWSPIIAKARRWVEKTTQSRPVPTGCTSWWAWGELLSDGHRPL